MLLQSCLWFPKFKLCFASEIGTFSIISNCLKKYSCTLFFTSGTYQLKKDCWKLDEENLVFRISSVFELKKKYSTHFSAIWKSNNTGTYNIGCCICNRRYYKICVWLALILIFYFTQIAGPSGCGKTQFCTMLSVLATLPGNRGGLEGKVLYMDTESAFSAER